MSGTLAERIRADAAKVAAATGATPGEMLISIDPDPRSAAPFFKVFDKALAYATAFRGLDAGSLTFQVSELVTKEEADRERAGADCATMPAQQRASAGGGRMAEREAPVMQQLRELHEQSDSLAGALADLRMRVHDIEKTVHGEPEPVTAGAQQGVGDAFGGAEPMATLNRIGAMQAEVDRQLDALGHILGDRPRRKPRRPRRHRLVATGPTVVHVGPQPAEVAPKPRRRTTTGTARKSRARR